MSPLRISTLYYTWMAAQGPKGLPAVSYPAIKVFMEQYILEGDTFYSCLCMMKSFLSDADGQASNETYEPLRVVE